MKKSTLRGFSLVEVVIALGLFAFALLIMVALLPTGIKTNKVSVEETNAVGILTTLEADLRNTHPSLNAGKSQYFGLPLPYILNASGNYVVNSALAVNNTTVPATCMTGVADDGSAVLSTATPPPHYQASVIYTSLPTAGSLAPIEARIVVTWPYRATTTISDLSNPAKVSGFLDAYVTFPAP